MPKYRCKYEYHVPKYRCKYEYHGGSGSYPQHIWTCIGALGATHFHVTDIGERDDLPRYSGGLEVHYRTPPYHMRDSAPSQDKCHLLGSPCWHDGTSLYANERLIPFWLVAPHDHERIFKMLQDEYEDRFGLKAESA